MKYRWLMSVLPVFLLRYMLVLEGPWQTDWVWTDGVLGKSFYQPPGILVPTFFF